MAWAAKRRNVAQSRRMGPQKCVAVVAAVSAVGGLISFERRPSSYKGQQFSEYLERLEALVVDKPMTVLMDNCKIHNALVTQEVINRLNINVLWCVPYRPDLNAIEFVWAIAKRKFRQLQLQRMMGTLQLSFEECVDRAMAAVTSE
jgi:transposase